jgi:glycosyltransferase involved in cell wall biosynthesis
MTISIVIPTFNDGQFLKRCLASVAAQTLPASEVIIVDDGSTSPDALDGLACAVQQFPATRVIRQLNAGPAAARNRGLDECSGEFVAFVDADDELTPNNLAWKREIFDKIPDAAAVFGGFLAVWPDGRRSQSDWRHYLGPLDASLIDRRGGIPGGLPLYMFRRTALEAIGGLDEELRVMEDFDAIIRLGRQGGRFAGSNELIYIRTIRPLSTSRGSLRRVFGATLKFLSKARSNRYFGRKELLRRYLEAVKRPVGVARLRLSLRQTRRQDRRCGRGRSI